MRTIICAVFVVTVFFGSLVRSAEESGDETSRLQNAIRNERILIERLENNRRYAAAAYLANKALMDSTLEALSGSRTKDESYRFKRQEMESASKLLSIQDETLRRMEYYQDKEATIDGRIEDSLTRIERYRKKLAALVSALD